MTVSSGACSFTLVLFCFPPKLSVYWHNAFKLNIHQTSNQIQVLDLVYQHCGEQAVVDECELIWPHIKLHRSTSRVASFMLTCTGYDCTSCCTTPACAGGWCTRTFMFRLLGAMSHFGRQCYKSVGMVLNHHAVGEGTVIIDHAQHWMHSSETTSEDGHLADTCTINPS